MNKLMSYGLLLAALMVGGGVFYHFVIYLPSLERQKEERAERERKAAEKQRELRQQAYEICQASARRIYEANWSSHCEIKRKSDLVNCVTDRSIWRTYGAQAEIYCMNNYGPAKSAPDCTLPRAMADSVNKILSQDQQKCMAEAKLGL